MHADDASRALAKEALFASSGDFYAPTIIARYAVDTCLRVGCACYVGSLTQPRGSRGNDPAVRAFRFASHDVWRHSK